MIEVKRQITVNAPVEKVWQVLALEFDRVGEWASPIASSAPNRKVLEVSGSPVGGRVCSVPGFGDVKETFTAYDEDNLTYSYEATDGLPFFVQKAANTWTLTPKGEQTIVDMHLVSRVNLIPGQLMRPIMRRQFAKQSTDIVEELKHYVETGRPHPRKVKAMQKAA